MSAAGREKDRNQAIDAPDTCNKHTTRFPRTILLKVVGSKQHYDRVLLHCLSGCRAPLSKLPSQASVDKCGVRSKTGDLINPVYKSKPMLRINIK